MNRNTAVTTWREVCGSDGIMALPPTGRLERFAERIEAITREECAIAVQKSFEWRGGHGEPGSPGSTELMKIIRGR